MAVIEYEPDVKYIVHGRVSRPWGYELILAIYDADENHVDNATMTFRVQPSAKTEADEIIRTLELYKVWRDTDPIVEEPLIPRSEVEEFLVDRGYLTTGQNLQDLVDKTPLIYKVWWFLRDNFIKNPSPDYLR